MPNEPDIQVGFWLNFLKIFRNQYSFLDLPAVPKCNPSLLSLVAFKQEPYAFDLVITDMTMPKMTGDVLAGHIKVLRQDIPVILCTGFSEKISKSNYAGAMIDEFLMKPVSVKAFNQTIRHLLDVSNTKDKTK